MFHIVLYEPEIPPNTGNIIRLCANTGITLHLIHPLGFQLEDRMLRRAGLDYHEWADIKEHTSWQGFLQESQPARILAFSTKGRNIYTEIAYRPGDTLLFGPETRGLPAEILNHPDNHQVLRIPMRNGSRSLNLSNAVAVVAYEAWRQQGFKEGV
ncbi:MAG: tRNA (uridine(34)/cytosine(34)/5-carboxymethylaminomethyluridine(34)-2'-O)-methyltransferase TrmL [Gammaproteobacteria bacterium]|nr:tRNA (uridine(34)/cytosine(34)/5-carboxymethylaminomethyluridine(34)-2'-O)-methyltransferase TrmL [Gammaproteobacteria bacterium]